ncbi:microtubule-associated serine/threonine-protein kinase 3-like isoform X2 [Dermacentor silvarum]|uniref:microtubule-associated serine/threonine-protein kinase 3-like isoform X2 n=1 Tax=Dermacentor silvarum TaxID=543639 RepID=UPI001899ADCB|nr:microtubule-associated serine/threonine-protein kinase 3-like isoform X2 [Dermacentor silvarum]
MATAAATTDRPSLDKRKASAKMLVSLYPRIPKTASVLLEFFIKRESKVSLMREPLSHFCQEEVVLHAQECQLKLTKQVITYQDVRDMVENLVGLHNMCLKKNPEVAKELGNTVRKLTIIVGEVATSLEKIAEVPVTDWMAIGDAIVNKLERLNPPKPLPFATFIPRMRDFKSLKMLGAGGFGAVYLANYRPANFVTTVKLVNMDRFSRHKQAAMDKVVASVIRNPFLVKYYCCFCVKEAYVTIMEYIAGLDLMRVVTKEEYLEIEAVRIIMAQLILALEHMHLRGFLHRDVKVSNMLILPGGRVKVIDFDTVKVCNGHCRAADWWSAGIVMYKLMTGRVPFRGKSKQLLRERIITSPLKWPRADEHPHSATTPAKDMTYRMLKKNPVERLGSRNYSDLKTHPFFDQFNWQMLYNKTDLCEIPSIAEIMNSDAAKDSKTVDPDDKRKHQQIDEMTDVSAESQKPLLCYASPSFKKLMLKVKASKTTIKLSDSFMESSGQSSTVIDYKANSPMSMSRTAPLSSMEGKDSVTTEKVDLMLYRKKKYLKFWGFGFSLRRVQGEEASLTYVDTVTKGSPADMSKVLPLDFILNVNGIAVADAPLPRVKKIISGAGDQMVLSVMSSSPYRLLTGRRDMLGVIRGMPLESAVVKAAALSCIGARPYGIGILDVDVADDRLKQSAKCFVLLYADVVSSNNRMVFPGDVLFEIDGTKVEGMSRMQVDQILGAGKPEVTLSVAPLSPLRKRRFLVSKLHETGMTDINVPSKSTAADID